MTNNYVNSKKGQARQQFEKVLDEYKSLFQDKTAPENQTVAYKKNVETTLNRLIQVADELDEHEPGNGIFSLIMIGLKANLRLKDRNTELEIKIRNMEKEIRRLKKR